MAQINLPFKVGQIVEAKSFEQGYRGAWFRCKILDTITWRKELYYNLEYLDYPDERIHKTKVFQSREKEKHLMVRPPYPPHYHEREQLKIKRDPEPLLIVHDSWKVGDLVDWWFKGCFWSGKFLELKENEAVQIELFPRPFGEGDNYEAWCKDLRPSLEWSLEDGWKVPFSMDGHKRQCGKLVKHKNEDADFCETEKAETEKATQHQTKRATQQLKGDGGLLLNIMKSDSIEAGVLDLEELIVRIQWLKSMLRPDFGEGAKSHWKYEDYRPSSTGR